MTNRRIPSCQGAAVQRESCTGTEALLLVKLLQCQQSYALEQECFNFACHTQK